MSMSLMSYANFLTLCLCLVAFPAFAGGKEEGVIFDLPETLRAKALKAARLQISEVEVLKMEKLFTSLDGLKKPSYRESHREFGDLLKTRQTIFVNMGEAFVVKGTDGIQLKKVIATYNILDCVGVAIWNPKHQVSALAHVSFRTDLNSLDPVLNEFAKDKENTEITLVSTFKTQLLFKITKYLAENGFKVTYFDSNDIYYTISPTGLTIRSIFHPKRFGKTEAELKGKSVEEVLKLMPPEDEANYSLTLSTETGALYKVARQNEMSVFLSALHKAGLTNDPDASGRFKLTQSEMEKTRGTSNRLKLRVYTVPGGLVKDLKQLAGAPALATDPAMGAAAGGSGQSQVQPASLPPAGIGNSSSQAPADGMKPDTKIGDQH